MHWDNPCIQNPQSAAPSQARNSTNAEQQQEKAGGKFCSSNKSDTASLPIVQQQRNRDTGIWWVSLTLNLLLTLVWWPHDRSHLQSTDQEKHTHCLIRPINPYGRINRALALGRTLKLPGLAKGIPHCLQPQRTCSCWHVLGVCLHMPLI